MTNNESVFRVCGLLLLAALILPACGGAPPRDDAQLAALNQRVELLMLFAACEDPAKELKLSELAPELGLKARCEAWRTQQIEAETAREAGRLDQERRATEFWQSSFDNEPREEPWAREAEAQLKLLYEGLRESEHYKQFSQYSRADCGAIAAPAIRCRTLTCRATFELSESTGECINTLWMMEENEWLEHGSGTGEPNGEFTFMFFRKGYLESDVLTLGLEQVLADEPRDEVWAEEAEKTLLAIGKSSAVYGGDPGDECTSALLECRSVTCRLTFPANPHGDCSRQYGDPWSNARLGMSPTSRSADGKSRTYYLVREGFIFPDVLTASK